MVASIEENGQRTASSADEPLLESTLIGLTYRGGAPSLVGSIVSTRETISLAVALTS